MGTDRDRILQKIRKCLALAASSNPTEAATAMRQAQALMAEHRLSEDDVSLAAVSEVSAPAQTTDLVRWESNLSITVAEAFGCDCYTSLKVVAKPGSTFGRKRTFVFVGVGPAPEVAGYAYEVLSRQCGKDRRAHMAKQPKTCKKKTKVARGDAFALGWCLGVQENLDRFAGNAARPEVVEKYMANKGLGQAKPKDRATGKNVSGADIGAGLAAGRHAELRRGVAGREPQLLIEG